MEQEQDIVGQMLAEIRQQEAKLMADLLRQQEQKQELLDQLLEEIQQQEAKLMTDLQQQEPAFFTHSLTRLLKRAKIKPRRERRRAPVVRTEAEAEAEAVNDLAEKAAELPPDAFMRLVYRLLALAYAKGLDLDPEPIRPMNRDLPSEFCLLD